jgi:hypothetical protein
VGLFLWFILFYRRYYDVIKVSPESIEIIGDDRVHRKNEYTFKINGLVGKVSYRVGDDDDTPWKPIFPNSEGVYIIPKGEIVDDVTIEAL